MFLFINCAKDCERHKLRPTVSGKICSRTLKNPSVSFCHSVLKRNAQLSSQNWFWPEWSFSWIRAAQFSRAGRPKGGNLESCCGKNVRVRLRPLRFNWLESVLSGGPERTSGKRSNFTGKRLWNFSYRFIPCPCIHRTTISVCAPPDHRKKKTESSSPLFRPRICRVLPCWWLSCYQCPHEVQLQVLTRASVCSQSATKITVSKILDFTKRC